MSQAMKSQWFAQGSGLNRRQILQNSSAGFGWLALSGIFGLEAATAQDKTAKTGTHFPAKAKNVIFCFMDGGPSHVDTFDPKPMLKQHEGKAIGEKAVSRRSQSSANRVWLGSPWHFRQRGQSGLWVSDLLPHIAGVADEICVVRSMLGELPLHGQQNLLLHTGRIIGQAPSLGAWISYGLGTENQNLPSYVLLNNDWVPNGGMENFGSSYLPALHQATMLRPTGVPVDNIVPTDSPQIQAKKLALIRSQDSEYTTKADDASTMQSAIQNYETAFRMQSAVPEIADVSHESEATKKLYG
ncbi:MAG: hypothetical protein RJA81_1786, partial [Planctomycetota bacterium]